MVCHPIPIFQLMTKIKSQWILLMLNKNHLPWTLLPNQYCHRYSDSHRPTTGCSHSVMSPVLTNNSNILFCFHCSGRMLLEGLSLRARLKYLGSSFPSVLPTVSNTPFSDQKNSIPSARALGTSIYTARSQSLLMPLMTPSSPGRPGARWMCVLCMRLRPCCWMEFQLQR